MLLCCYAVMLLCGYAVMQVCCYAVIQLRCYAVMLSKYFCCHSWVLHLFPTGCKICFHSFFKFAKIYVKWNLCKSSIMYVRELLYIACVCPYTLRAYVPIHRVCMSLYIACVCPYTLRVYVPIHCICMSRYIYHIYAPVY